MAAPKKTPDQWKHGSSTYTNHGCRCEVCTKAHNKYMQSLRMRRSKMEIPPEVTHGTSSTYCNWGCRCVPCKDGHAARYREYRQQKKEAAEG